MRTISCKLEDLKNMTLHIGYEGENDYTSVRIDAGSVFAQYPEAVPSLKVQPPKGNMYPVIVTRDGDIVIWNVSDSDTASNGNGEIQLTFTENTVVVKSCTGKTLVHRSLKATGPAPDPLIDFIDMAEEVVGEAQDAAEAAEAAAQHAPMIGLDGYWYKWDAETEGYVKTDTKARGEDGANGVGITSVEKISTVGLVDTYRINFTNGTNTTYTVTNGQDGSVPIDDTTPAANKVFSSAKVDEELTDVKTAIHGTNDNLDAIAENGFYSKGTQQIFYDLLKGQINNDASKPFEQTVNTNQMDCGYIVIQKDDIPAGLYYDNTKYKVNTVFIKNGYQVSGTYTGWQTTSPVQYNAPNDWDAIALNVKRLSGIYGTGELKTALYKYDIVIVGQLATKSFVESYIPKGKKCIYPDGFESRIKPDVYNIGRFVADIDPNDYKIQGSGEVWVAADGNDSTGDGTENNPFATITKALTQSAVTIHIKEGTYTQGTHYTTSCNLAGKNVIGHGTVVFENDSSGHYAMVNASAYIENIIFKHGNATTNSAFVAVCGSSGQTVCLVSCVFRDSGSNGLSVDGIDAVLVDCVAYGNKLDGFNYHARTVSSVTYIPNVIEIDCKAYNNGSDQSGSDSCNGSTSHDGTKIIRLNGEYYSCYGGVIAEIALAGEEPTISVNFGVLAHDSTGTGTYKASFWASVNTKMYLYDCSCYGGTYDVSAINDSLVVSRRLTTGRDVPAVNKAETATVYQY